MRRDGLTRRDFLIGSVGAGVLIGSAASYALKSRGKELRAETFIAKVPHYGVDIADVIRRGLHELGVESKEIRGKRILLKPNLVEAGAGRGHVNTHPHIIRGAAEAFMHLGASTVVVAEGTAHHTDTLFVLEESGTGDVLVEDRIPFVDLNYDVGYVTPNLGRRTRLKTFTFPAAIRSADWIVSLAKMKTHHWAGVTLSMKNLIGVMPGVYYGWPKNVFHWEGINESIVDIYATLRPRFAIVDGIVGMEGDGPIMGDARPAGVVIMGRELASVDATAARIMGINPLRVSHLAAAASSSAGVVRENAILQKGEAIQSVRIDFALSRGIPAHEGIGNY